MSCSDAPLPARRCGCEWHAWLTRLALSAMSCTATVLAVDLSLHLLTDYAYEWHAEPRHEGIRLESLSVILGSTLSGAF